MGPEQNGITVRAAGGWEPRYQALDAWRGLACLMVVVHHAAYAVSWAEAGDSWPRWLVLLAVRRMDLGVALFFVISGYCIAASAAASARRNEAPTAFLTRRFWRIYPPYWFALLGFGAWIAWFDAAGLAHYYCGPFGVQMDRPHDLDWRQWVGNLTLTETWRPHLFGPDRNVFTGVAWSLCFEEQFYMICFLILWLAPRRLFAALAGVSVVVASVRGYAWWVGGLSAFKGTFPLLWHEFAVGLVVYYRLVVAARKPEKRLIEVSLALLCGAGLWTGGRTTAVAAGFGLLLIAGRRWDGLAASAFWLVPLRACGRRCYSIYLAHLPFGVIGNQWLYELGVTSFWSRVLVMVPLASAVGIAAGWFFHSAVESRFLGAPPTVGGLFSRLRSRRRRQPSLAGASSAGST